MKSKKTELNLKFISKAVILLIKEMFIYLGIGAIVLMRNFVSITVNQMASQVEIQRLNKDITLAVSEFVINNQYRFMAIFNVAIFLLIIVGIIVFVKDIIKILNTFKEGVKK